MNSTAAIMADIDHTLTACIGLAIDSPEAVAEIERLVSRHGAAPLLRALILSRAELIARRLARGDA